MTASVSTKVNPSFRASRRPTVVFPVPMKPVSTTFQSSAFMTAMYDLTNLARRVSPTWRCASISARYPSGDVTRPSVLLLHGPNLTSSARREPHIYGSATLEDYVAATRSAAAGHDLDLEDFQSNHEGQIIDAIHAARGRCAAILINPGAFTHYAWGIHDALATFTGPIIEVHISNPNAREPWRHTSVVSPVATGTIVGLGLHGYELAIDAIAQRLAAA